MQHRILIIDDDVDMRGVIRRWLERAGHIVDEAVDGRAGATTVLEGKHDVAFVDIGLPVLDGYDIARRVRASPVSKSVCLVALTASTDDPTVAFNAGFDAHVFKPVQEKTIQAVLEEIARRLGA
jgi:CheY-like chemotaxis protein